MSNFDEHVIVRKCEQVAREKRSDSYGTTLISRRSKLCDPEIDSLEIPELQREWLTPIPELVPERALELVPERALELVPERVPGLVLEQPRLGYSGYRERREPRGGR